MCGIVGFINFGANGANTERAAVLDAMCHAIIHRGPDDQGVFLNPTAALGMRRLSIIDLPGGHQPLSGCDDALTIVFNGEIYNYQELQEKLSSLGHRFHTRSDTETIPHAYEEYGADCVQHLRGMFAFALWDERRRQLLLARDRVGKKPLYYTTTRQGVFVFASELKSLLAHPQVEREIDREALDAYLSFGYVPDPLCIFRNIRKLAPGHRLLLTAEGLQVEPYWDFCYQPDEPPRSSESYTEELRVLLEDAVRVRLMSDVPLGAFLSGGVDSSAIVGLMSRLTNRPVKTFTIGFAEEPYNELAPARLAARHFGAEHTELMLEPEACDIAEELAWHCDEPFADSSAIPTFLVSKLAREHVTVALSGDGGDELFAGYTRYLPAHRHSGWTALPLSLRRGLLQSISRRLPHGFWGRNYFHDVAFNALERYVENISFFTQLAKGSLYTADFRAAAPPLRAAAARFRAYAEGIDTGDETDSLLYLDGKTYLPGDILTKVDRTSMAVSLEIRSPLLDQNLIDFVTRIPAQMKLRGNEAKYIFKQAVRELVPPEILNRPKQGFAVPLDLWLKQQLREKVRDTLTDTRTRQRGYFRQEYVELLLEEHQRGRRNHSPRLWSLYMLELWHRQFVDKPRPAVVPSGSKFKVQSLVESL
jgi:asparagine synthase (glutamine-hydrolysing)